MDSLCDNLNYTFKNEKLLEEALTHPSLSKKKKNGTKFNYEKLEFLGDAILSSIISDYLVKNHQYENEGNLSKRKAFLVSANIIYKIAKEKVFLDRFIMMSEGEKKNGGATKISNLENCMEAIIGAIFLDSDFETVRHVVLGLWLDIDSNLSEAPQSPKMRLQEWSQKHLKTLPQYKLIDEIKEKDSNIFTMRLELDNLNSFNANGKSKKEAEKKAAEMALEYLEERDLL
ncbi:MAG: ribonuclease III [Rickettsiales bacterium]|jgi:ribonuclease III|nr:ribonuclease III [Rickettsiales bacterium]